MLRSNLNVLHYNKLSFPRPYVNKNKSNLDFDAGIGVVLEDIPDHMVVESILYSSFGVPADADTSANVVPDYIVPESVFVAAAAET